MNTQDKFERRIEAVVSEVGTRSGLRQTPLYEVVNDRDFANRGVLRIQPTYSFNTVMRLEYDFQTNSATITVRPKIEGVGRADDDGSSTLVRCNGGFTDLDKVIDAVVTFLEAREAK